MKAVQGLGHGNSRERWLGFCTLYFCFPTKTLFTWSGVARSSGVSFFCFVSSRA